MRAIQGVCWVVAVLACSATAGCKVTVQEGDEDAAADTVVVQGQSAPPQAAQAAADSLRFVVDISERKLHVLRGADTVRVEPVAVGTSKYPTPTGEWTIHRVDWNPDWTPPPGEEWTEDKEPQPPGSPENPMGLARLVFKMPYTIHGTKERQSLGTASSHGSIRVANEAVVELGRMIMDAGGAGRPESFFQQVQADRTRMHQVEIPRPIPIKVQE